MDKPEQSMLGRIRAALGKNNRFTAGVSFAFLFLLMLALFAFMIAGLHRFGLIELPAFIQDLFFKTAEEKPESEKNDKNIYDHLIKSSGDPGPSPGGGFVLEITLENVREAIASTKMPDNLHLEMEARYYADDGKTTTRAEHMSLWKKGEKYKYLLSVDSVLEETYTNDSKYEQIENHATGSLLIRNAAPSFSVGDIPHMPDINHYLDLLEGGEIKVFAIKQNEQNGENIIEIKYDLPQLDQYELIQISLDTGIVLWVRSFNKTHGGQFYECKTKVNAAYYSGAETKAEIDNFLFLIPNS